MLYLGLFFSIIIPVLLGLCILSFILKQKKIGGLYRLALSYGLGAGVLTIFMLLLAFMRISLILSFLAPVIIAVLIVCFVIIKRNHYIIFEKISRIPKLSRLEILMVAIIVFEVIFVFSQGLLRPIFAFDALANWSLRAKVIFTENIIPLETSHPFYLGGGGHINYPLHLSLFQAWTALWMGSFYDSMISALFALYFLCLIGLVYAGLRYFCSRKYSLLFTMFLSTMPLITYHGFSAYADLPLAFYFTGAVISFYVFIKKQQTPYLYISGLFAGIGSWTKFEGILLAVVLFVVVSVYGIARKRFHKS
ncbi:glycosyltransferase family 39 protein [Patescibacteria group bacterium AH-259-L07]|nr:glycosyltransferase family 39 protein [Patescibacteria group bacterium AH-259-L07]